MPISVKGNYSSRATAYRDGARGGWGGGRKISTFRALVLATRSRHVTGRHSVFRDLVGMRQIRHLLVIFRAYVYVWNGPIVSNVSY